MAIFQAFRALRPVSEKAADVAALPYDVVDRAEAKAIGDKNPDSFLHVDRAEICRMIQICMTRKYMNAQDRIC